MIPWSFDNKEMLIVSDALEIAEETIGDFFKFSFGQWKRHRYDIRTLTHLEEIEIVRGAFASVEKGSRKAVDVDFSRQKKDFYFICLQDHHILEALDRDKQLGMVPLLVYVFTHELVHIVRFCNFSQRFEVSDKKEREKEERIVQATTYEILKNLTLHKLDYILQSYENKRVCNYALC
jgi:hypothetical protein